jgi:hypothetical protein
VRGEERKQRKAETSQVPAIGNFTAFLLDAMSGKARRCSLDNATSAR